MPRRLALACNHVRSPAISAARPVSWLDVPGTAVVGCPLHEWDMIRAPPHPCAMRSATCSALLRRPDVIVTRGFSRIASAIRDRSGSARSSTRLDTGSRPGRPERGADAVGPGGLDEAGDGAEVGGGAGHEPPNVLLRGHEL